VSLLPVSRRLLHGGLNSPGAYWSWGPTNVPDLMNPKMVWNGDRQGMIPRIQAS
jgi:hypothetical protein